MKRVIAIGLASVTLGLLGGCGSCAKRNDDSAATGEPSIHVRPKRLGGRIHMRNHGEGGPAAAGSAEGDHAADGDGG